MLFDFRAEYGQRSGYKAGSAIGVVARAAALYITDPALELRAARLVQLTSDQRFKCPGDGRKAEAARSTLPGGLFGQPTQHPAGFSQWADAGRQSKHDTCA